MTAYHGGKDTVLRSIKYRVDPNVTRHVKAYLASKAELTSNGVHVKHLYSLTDQSE